LRVLENGMLRKRFGSKRGGVTGGWRKLYNEELHGLYFLPNVILVNRSRRMRWVTNVTNMRDNGYVEIVVGKREGKRPRGRLRHR
jgi:hypothetical protein